MKQIKHTIISIEAEKACVRIQHPSPWEHSTSNRIKLQHDKVLIGKIHSTYHTQWWKTVFPLKSGIKQGCPVLSLLFNIVLEVLARKIRQEHKIKGIQIGKSVVKLFLLRWYALMCWKT